MLMRGIAVVAAAIVTGCESGAAYEFTVPIDSVRAPQAVARGDTLRVRVWGGVGRDQCSRLKRIVRTRGAGNLSLQFVGERREDGDCLLAPVFLDHLETIAPPHTGAILIRVVQPNGGELSRLVQVTE